MFDGWLSCSPHYSARPGSTAYPYPTQTLSSPELHQDSSHLWKTIIWTPFGPVLGGARAAQTPQNVANRAYSGQKPHLELGSGHSEGWKVMETIIAHSFICAPFGYANEQGNPTSWHMSAPPAVPLFFVDRPCHPLAGPESWLPSVLSTRFPGVGRSHPQSSP